jgi:hypothetical protein
MIELRWIQRRPVGERPGSAGLLAAGQVVALADNRSLLDCYLQGLARFQTQTGWKRELAIMLSMILLLTSG